MNNFLFTFLARFAGLFLVVLLRGEGIFESNIMYVADDPIQPLEVQIFATTTTAEDFVVLLLLEVVRSPLSFSSRRPNSTQISIASRPHFIL
jgi:hypothetical protein